MTKRLRFENVKISVEFSFTENCGDSRILSWLRFVHVLRKREEIADNENKNKSIKSEVVCL